MLTVILASSACGHRGNANSTALLADLLLEEDLTDEQHFLVWFADERHSVTTHWIAGTDVETVWLGSTRGLFIPDPDHLTELTTTMVRLHLCDCDALPASSDESGCAHSDDIRTAVLPALVNPESGEKQPLLGAEELRYASNVRDYRLHARVTAVIGPYVFVTYEEYAPGCESDTPPWAYGHAVAEIPSGRPAALLTEAEYRHIDENEREIAVAEINRARRSPVSSAQVRLSLIEPRYAAPMGYHLQYHFLHYEEIPLQSTTVDNSFVRTVQVEGQQIPEALQPFVLSPVPVSAFHLANPHLTVIGWRQIDPTDSLQEKLRDLFTAR